MLDRKILIPIIVGFVAIVTINFVYFEKGTHYSDENKSLVVSEKIFMKENGFVVQENRKIKNIEKFTYVVYKEIKGEYIEQKEVLASEDLMEQFFSNDILRKNEGLAFENVKFTKIHSMADVDVLKANPDQLEKGLFKHFDVFIYKKEGKIDKLKFENREPILVGDKTIKQFKSYQINLKGRTVRNTEIIYLIGKQKFKLLVKTVYAI